MANTEVANELMILLYEVCLVAKIISIHEVNKNSILLFENQSF